MPYPYYPNYPTYPNYQPNGQQTMPYYPQYPMAQGPAQQPAIPGQNMQQAPVQPAPVQVQNGGTISVHNIDEARNWPVAPGNSVTFVDENAGFVYIKTSRNQFERPDFAVYRMEKIEDTAQTSAESPTTAPSGQDGKSIDYAEKADLTALAGVVSGMNNMLGTMQKDIETMKGDMYGVVGKKSAPSKKETAKKEENEDA